MSAKPHRMWGTKEMAGCMKVMRVLQSYLDGYSDEVTARRIANHLEACRRCGLEAATYRELKASLARRAPQVDADIVERLRAFGQSLADRPLEEDGSGHVPPPA
jgi:anti-sigma factor RsiW